MHITILALGSRGDVQPFVALGNALLRLGHRVCIAAATDYRDLAVGSGLEFAPVVGSIRAIMNFDLVYEALDAANKPLPLGFAHRFLEHVSPLVQQIVADCFRACMLTDALVVSTLGCYPGLSIAERLGVPIVPVHFHPFAPTEAFPDMSFVELPHWMPGRSHYNKLTHYLTPHGMAQLLRPALNRARAEILGLSPIGPVQQFRRTAARLSFVLHGYSSILVPRPSDWEPAHQLTGYWFGEQNNVWQPSADLASFLDDGPPPVYVGFGSILAGRHPEQATALIVRALKLAGQRGILFRGWGDLGGGTLPGHVLAVDSVPHDWLFPRVAGVVTHGGAGTVAAALRAGLPPIVVPFFGDQRFWGRQVARLGLGPSPIPRAELSAEALAAAIRTATTNGAMRRRARSVGRLLEAEQGAERAARSLERYLMGEP